MLSFPNDIFLLVFVFSINLRHVTTFFSGSYERIDWTRCIEFGVREIDGNLRRWKPLNILPLDLNIRPSPTIDIVLEF